MMKRDYILWQISGVDINMTQYNYKIKASTLPKFIQKAILWGGKEIVEIKINGEHYEIVDDLKGKRKKW